MSVLNDRDLMTYALRETMEREKKLIIKLKEYQRFTRDRTLKNLFLELLITSESRINIIQNEMNNLYVNQE
ncbi:MAG: hypothetical protein ACOY46_10620 [Bacillota bacterium]